MSRPRTTLLAAALAAASTTLTGCGSSGAPPLRPAHSPDGTLVITAEQIAASDARDAWEVLRYSGAPVTLYDGGNRSPSRIQRRGRSSILLNDGAIVMVDGARLSNPEGLKNIRAAMIDVVQIMTGARATQLYGTGAVGGAVVIRTRTVASGGTPEG